MICMNINELNYDLAENCNAARETWLTCEFAFGNSVYTKRIGLLRNLLSISFDDCKSVKDYTDQVVSIVQELETISYTVENSWLGGLLSKGLPGEYHTNVIQLGSSEKKPTTDSMELRILQSMEKPEEVELRVNKQVLKVREGRTGVKTRSE